MFPHRLVAAHPEFRVAGDTIDYFSTVCYSQQFSASDFMYPSVYGLYSYGVGDILQYRNYQEFAGLWAGVQSRYIDTVTARFLLPDGSISFTVSRRYYAAGVSPMPPHIYNFGAESYVIAARCPFDTLHMPEETGIEHMLFYTPASAAPCVGGPVYSVVSQSLFQWFEPCEYEEIYKNGYGKIYEGNCATAREGRYNVQVFSVVGGEQCGTYVPVPVGVGGVTEQKPAVTTFPNPANDVLNIQAGSLRRYKVVMTSAIGQVVSDDTFCGDSFSVNTAQLAPGMYLLIIVNEAGARHIEPVTIQH